MIIFPQELQRRLDQTLGKPGSYLAGIDRVGNVKPMTVGARLYRVEQQVKSSTDFAPPPRFFPSQSLLPLCAGLFDLYHDISIFNSKQSRVQKSIISG